MFSLKTSTLTFILVFVLIIQIEAQAPNPPAGSDSLIAALMKACDDNNLDQVKTLIDQGAPVNGTVPGERYAFTPLTAAADSGNVDVLKYLIAKGAKPDLADIQGSTPLLHACSTDHTDCALALLEAGADPNLGSKWQRYPLMYSAQKGNDQIVSALIAHHADVDANSNGGPATWWAASNGRASTLKLLIDAGAKLDLKPMSAGRKPSEKQTSLLGLAVDSGDSETLNLLLSHGVDVNEAGPGGKTALMEAARQNAKDVATLLINHGADINATDLQGETALTYAGDLGDGEIVQLLKDKGAKRTDVHIIAKPKPDRPLTPGSEWALAVGAIYAQVNGTNPHVLGHDETVTVDEIKANLKEYWGITDKKSFLKQVDWLSTSGHRVEFQKAGADLAALSDEDFAARLAAAPLKATQAEAIRKSYLKWKDKSGLAWDLCRAADLINNGYSARYLNENEAWQLLYYNARLMQAGFSSWQEMSDNFLDGREIWAGKRDPRFEACSQLLLNPQDPNSPWNENPWKTELPAN